MKRLSFEVIPLEAINALLPALDFTALLASNDSSAVYQARQRSLDRDVAVKVLSPQVSDDDSFRQRFKSTASAMAKLNHPNLISVFDSGYFDGMLYVVMEFVPGQPLARSMAGQPVDLQQATALIDGICAGIAHAHDHQIIHGSLNPGNILLTLNAEPKISSFGISSCPETGTHSAANARFAAPETHEDPNRVDRRSDIHAIGAILYELITGQPHGPQAPPPSALSTCSTEMDEVWRMATNPDPDQRFQDAKTLAAAVANARSAAHVPLTSAMPASKRLATTPAGSISGKPVSPPSTTRQALRPPTSANSKLVRNLCIIAVLLVGIFFAWRNNSAARAANEKRNREILALNKADKDRVIEEARQHNPAQQDRRRQDTDSSEASDASAMMGNEIIESPEESLARLREALASGMRDELPVGSIHQDDSDYLLVSTPMSWVEATRYAEEHGGHLAIPNASADLTWLASQVPDTTGIWIGVASCGRNAWALADGSIWKPGKKPAGIGNYIALDKFGFLRAENGRARHPFLIQWHRDGSNPGALPTLLALTQRSLGQPEPQFPPGTRAIGGRYYLFVSRPMRWRDAVDVAESAGGHLAVPSETAEFISLEEIANDVTTENDIWIGGFLRDDHWLWITGEPWQTAKWAEDSNPLTPDSAVILRPNRGWDARSQSESATGFIIEWSDGIHSPSTAKPTMPLPEGELAALEKRARELITSADAKRTEKLAANVEKFTTDLGYYRRKLNRSERTKWTPHINRLQDTIRDNRLPSSIPRSSGIKLSDQMAELLQKHTRDQEKFDLEFHAGSEKLRTFYVARLRSEKTKAEQSGQAKVADSIGANIRFAGDLEDWVGSFGVTLQPESRFVPEIPRKKQPKHPDPLDPDASPGNQAH